MPVQFIHCTPDAEALIVRMARVSNPENADNLETAPRLLRYLIRHQHWSPFDLASLCVCITTERDIAAQILRHRSFSFQEFCLAGDARITINTSDGSIQRIAIAELYRKWQSPRFKARFARAYDQELERFISAPIKSVYSSGQKPVYEFRIGESVSERAIRCTREHRVLTKECGFVPFGTAFDEGLTVAINGAPSTMLPYQDPQVLKTGAWMGSTRFAKEHGIAEVTARKWFRQHGIKPYNPTNAAASTIDAPFRVRLTSYMKWARKNIRVDVCQECGGDGSDSRLELSHIQAHDGDPSLAFNDSNLQTLCARCHRRHDIAIQGKRYGWTLGMTAKWGRITSQTYLGIQETFDIEMNHPTHNFVADGVVVHNSQRYAKTIPAEIPAFRRQDTKNRQNSTDDLPEDVLQYATTRAAGVIADAYLAYEELLELGIAKECARRLLPLCTPTTLYMQGSLRSWLHYIQLRTEAGTQAEHRTIAQDAQAIFSAQFPVIAAAAWPSP